jgi:hypothetical protein
VFDELAKILNANCEIWEPLPGPQTEAFYSEADVLFYGGSAGGAKTDLLLGLALTAHQRSIIFRRESTQLQGIYDRLTEILGSRDGFNSQDKIWRLPQLGGRQIEFGSCKDVGDEIAYQGRPHDLKGFDEITHFTEAQFRFLCGWKRTTKQGQRVRVVCTGNPPTDSDGEWVNRYFAPWLDPHAPRPAEPGELRYFAMLDGVDTELENGLPFTHCGELIIPESRTFIRSKVTDNPFLMATGYQQTLQMLPEPLRSQMLHGNFMAGTDDNPFQVIPTDWVRQAQARWKAEDRYERAMDAMGVDVARGGRDETVLMRRHGPWFDEPLIYPGTSTPDGPAVASLVLVNLRDAAPVQVDVIGVGGSVYDHLNGNNIHAVGLNSSEKSHKRDRSGKLGFANLRAAMWWDMREALDPQYGSNLALPPGSNVRADLCAPRWKLTSRGILVEPKYNSETEKGIVSRIGRSNNIGDAIVYAYVKTPKRAVAGGSGIDPILLAKIQERHFGGMPGPMSS